MPQRRLSPALSISYLCVLLVAAVCSVAAAPDFEAIGRDVVTELSSGAFDKVVARFDQKMSAGLPREKLAATWDTLIKQVGSYKSVTSARVFAVPAQSVHAVDLTTAFEKTPFVIRLAFNDEGKIAGLFFLPSKPQAEWTAPPYADPSRFSETAVVVGAFKLPGTVSMPTAEAPVPAIVLVHGSGPQDRDEMIGPNKVFKDLAWGLASRGIAVLRYDKRSLVAPMKGGTVKDEVIDDVSAGVDVLTAQGSVNRKRVFVLGHSLGGMLVPRIAALRPDVAGIIVMAGTTRPLEDVIVDQFRYLRGPESPETAAAQEFVRRVRDPLLSPDATIDFMGSPMPASYWLDLRGYRPEEVAAMLRRPMLVLQGGRDYQVTLADFEGWKRALDGQAHATLKLYPAMNHLFIPGEGRSMPEEYLRPGHVDPQVISDIAEWIQRS